MTMTMAGTKAGMPMTAALPLARPRALSTRMPAPTCSWPVTSAAVAASYRHGALGRDLRPAFHNSIARTDAAVLNLGKRGGFGAKQAAPPRGVPR
jgi:hypothetical protein